MRRRKMSAFERIGYYRSRTVSRRQRGENPAPVEIAGLAPPCPHRESLGKYREKDEKIAAQMSVITNICASVPGVVFTF